MDLSSFYSSSSILAFISLISTSTSFSDFYIVPLSSFRFNRHKRALLRFFRRRYSSEGKNFLSEMSDALLTTSKSKIKSPHFTKLLFLGSLAFPFLPASSESGEYYTPSGMFFSISAVTRAFCLFLVFLFFTELEALLALRFLLDDFCCDVVIIIV